MILQVLCFYSVSPLTRVQQFSTLLHPGESDLGISGSIPSEIFRLASLEGTPYFSSR